MDNDADTIMRLIASTIDSVPIPSGYKPWNERILLGCWAAKYIPLCQTYLPSYPITHIGFSISYARTFLTPTLPNVSFNMLQKVLVGPFGSKFLRDVRRANRPILTWTVNEVQWMRWCIGKGVDGVITDDPKLFLEVGKEYLEDEAAVVEGKGKRKGNSLGVRDYMGVVGIHLLVMMFGWLFWWRNPPVGVGKEKESKLKERGMRRGRIAL